MVAMGDIGTSGVIWTFGDGDSVVGNPVFYSWGLPGTYTVSVTSIFRGCPDTIKQRVINVFSAPQLNLGNDTSICPGSNRIMLYDHANAGASGVSWLWNTEETTPTIFVGTPGLYYAIVSNHGCEVSDSVFVSNDCYLDIPNVFTPNGDGINDYFFPRQLLSRGLVYFKLNIYNRWGELIFQTTSLDGCGWDGNFNGIPQPEGVFVYIIDAGFKDNEQFQRKGNLTLLR
jgi:gliding motility-associated-like protein